MESSPSYPEWLKWFARTLLVIASTLSVVIAVRGAREDLRKWMFDKTLGHGTPSETLGERSNPSVSDENIADVISESVVDQDTEVGGGTA
jgi:hypothetical protein